jgi:hypothetical protein
MLNGVFVLSPFAWNNSASSATGNNTDTALFPGQGGVIETISVYFANVGLAPVNQLVDIDFALRVDYADTALVVTVPTGEVGPEYSSANPITIAAGGGHIIQISGTPSGNPGGSAWRVRAVLTGYLNTA